MKKRILIYIILLFVLAGCKKPNETIEDDANFCSCLNTESMDKTIPFVDEFLAGLHEDMEDEKKLEDLITWFNAQPCIQDAAVYCQSCIQSQPPSSKIAFSFDENGITKEYILDVSMTCPLKALEYHVPVEIPSWDYFLRGNLKWNPIPSSKVVVFNSNDDFQYYVTGNVMIYWPMTDFDFSEHSVIAVSGSSFDVYRISDITGSLHQHGDHYVLNIEIAWNDNDNKNPLPWTYAMATNKLSENSQIETVITYRKYDGDNYYYYGGKKNFMRQRADKIFLHISPDASVEQIQAIINSDPSLRLAIRQNWEDYYHLGSLYLYLETKNGSRIPAVTLESFKKKEGVIYASYLSNVNPFVAITNEFLVKLKPETSYKQFQELMEKYPNILSVEEGFLYREYKLYVSKTSGLNTLQLANLFYETGLFEYATPNMIIFDLIF